MTATTTALPPLPEFGTPVSAARSAPDTLRLLAERRSTPAAQMAPGGPTREETAHLIAMASRVPDHGKLAPWRFIVFDGAARGQAGVILEEEFRKVEPDAPAERFAQERDRFTRAGTVIAVLSSPVVPHKIPVWEQVLSAGAVCQSLLMGAHAMGYASQWLTEWYAYHPGVLSRFGVLPGEQVAGWIYLGNPPEDCRERVRPNAAERTSYFAE